MQESTGSTHAKSGTVSTKPSSSGAQTVDRGVNAARMTAFALIVGVAVTVGLTVGYGEESWPLGILATFLAVIAMCVLLAVIHKVPAVRTRVMEAMHRLTGQ
jgi:hypothetical protein